MSKAVYLFLPDKLADWEPGFAIAGINNPDMQREPGRFHIRTASIGGSTVTSTGGLRIQADDPLDTVNPDGAAMLILAGGQSWDTSETANAPAAELGKRFLAAGVPVAAICGATLGLARVGAFTSRQHTSNSPEYLAASGYRGKSHYRKKLVVTDGDLITAGSMASLEFARAIFEKLELYTPEVLEAWYGLFSTRKAEYFAALMKASGAQ